MVILYLYVYTGTELRAASPNGTSFQVCCLHLCPGTRAPLGRGDGRAASLRKDDLTQMSAAPPHLNIKTKYSFLIFLSACLLLLCFEHDQEKPRHRFKKLQIDKLDINSDVFEELAKLYSYLFRCVE